MIINRSNKPDYYVIDRYLPAKTSRRQTAGKLQFKDVLYITIFMLIFVGVFHSAELALDRFYSMQIAKAHQTILISDK